MFRRLCHSTSSKIARQMKKNSWKITISICNINCRLRVRKFGRFADLRIRIAIPSLEQKDQKECALLCFQLPTKNIYLSWIFKEQWSHCHLCSQYCCDRQDGLKVAHLYDLKSQKLSVYFPLPYDKWLI